MSRMSKPPLIRHSVLANKWYVITRYAEKGTHIEAHTKHDVTDQIAAIMSAADAEIADLKAKVERYEKALCAIDMILANDGLTDEQAFRQISDEVAGVRPAPHQEEEESHGTDD